MKTICICGGGNLGIVCAGIFTSQGHTVNILTGHPEDWSSHIRVTDPRGRIFEGNISNISSRPIEVVGGADIILLCVPGYLIENTLNQIKPYINEYTIVGSIVSSTGFFFKAHECLNSKTQLFGFQRVPFISRTVEYGKHGLLLGYKDSLKIAFENVNFVKETKQLFEQLFLTPIIVADNYLEVSLSNSNPILHTGRLYAMWKESKGLPFKNPPLFYRDWTDLASEYIVEMDLEFHELLKELKIPNGAIPSLLEYYDVSDATALTEKIRTIEAFKTITAPLRETFDGWVLDTGCRYFTEDFNFGLKYIRDLADETSVECPRIDEVYEWGRSIMCI